MFALNARDRVSVSCDVALRPESQLRYARRYRCAGSLDGIPSVDTGDDECFTIELDVNHQTLGDEARDVSLVLDLLASGSPESQLGGLEIAERNLQRDTWLATFIRSGVCPCFS
jgi:hypothetical protein